MKPKIIEIFNNGNENYLRIKIVDKRSTKNITNLARVFSDLKIQDYLESEPEVISTKYYKWIGRHEFYKTKNFVIHILYEKNAIHLIVKCSLKDRERLIKTIHKYSFS